MSLPRFFLTALFPHISLTVLSLSLSPPLLLLLLLLLFLFLFLFIFTKGVSQQLIKFLSLKEKIEYDIKQSGHKNLKLLEQLYISNYSCNKKLYMKQVFWLIFSWFIFSGLYKVQVHLKLLMHKICSVLREIIRFT